MNPTQKDAAADMSPVCSYLIFPLLTSGLLETSIPVDICLQNLYLWVFLLQLSRGWRYGHMVRICVRSRSSAPRSPGFTCAGSAREGGERTWPLSGQVEESGSCENRLMELKAYFDGAIFMLHSLATRFAVGFIQLSLPPQKHRMLMLLGTDVNPGKQILAYF